MSTPSESPISAASPGPNVKVLLKEYELCTGDANHLEDMIWVTAGIFLTASVAGIGILGATLPPHPMPYDYAVRIGIGILSIALVQAWRSIAARWHSLQQTMYYRVVEIESQLDMYKARYVIYLDAALKKREYPAAQQVQTMVKVMRPQYKPQVVRRIVRRLAWIITLGWILLLLSQVLSFAGLL